MRRAGLVLVALLALLLNACGVFGGGGITITADFDDVVDLVPRAHVRVGDVPVGTVTRIELTDDGRARVTMRIDPDVELPAEVEAHLRKTALLGERFVELVPVGTTGRLADGTHIERTKVISELEELVATGNELLAFVAADSLAAAVQTGAQAFGGQGATLGGFLEDLEAFVGEFEAGKDDLLRLIDALDRFVGGIAVAAEDNAAALEALARASRAFEEEDDRLLDALDDLRRLSVVGTRIMRDHREQTDNAVRRLRMVLDQLVRIDGALQGLLTWLPRHNLHVPNGVLNEFAQVWLDFIVCGFNETDGDPTRDCTPPNPGQSNEPPPFSPNPPECNDDHSKCPGRPQGVEP